MQTGYCAKCGGEQVMWDVKVQGLIMWRCFRCRDLISRDFKFRIKLNFPYTKDALEVRNR